ncbi:hypothetical protein E3N88_40327 [Mikania micrantha]|uniref:Reverse transcriptase domain-containing protein n=1 Tax=Mikania micrantha TaxID=192012 RepID=A0A5N6LM97_9ASTR|nr:hypothetical protein E3N88_40327 [Mikania micrantha]
MVTAYDLTSIQPMIRLAHKLTDQAVAQGKLPKRGEHLKPQEPKRKWEPSNNRTFSPQQPTQDHPAPTKAFTATQSNNQGKGDIRATAQNATAATTITSARAKGSSTQTVEGMGTWLRNCPQNKNAGGNSARGRVFVIGYGEAKDGPNVVTGTFLLNNVYASILFYTDADRSFISSNFSKLLNITPTPLDYKYTVELADGKMIEKQHIYKGCVLTLADHELEIDLMPVTLKSFDVVVGMEWLSANHVEIVCNEKRVRVTLQSEEQISIQGERRRIPLHIMSCMKANKYLQKGYKAILALVTEQPKKERRIEDIAVTL